MKLRLFFKRLFFGLVIFGLLGIGSIVYFEVNKNKLLTDFKVFIQTQLSRTTGKNITLGNLEGGVFNGITINQLVIAQPKNGGVSCPLFEAKQLILNYRYWDIMLGRFDKLRYVRLNSPVLYLNISQGGKVIKSDKISLEMANLFSWGNKNNKISVFIDDGSLALGQVPHHYGAGQGHILFSNINGAIIAGQDCLECSLLQGQGFGLDMSLKGAITWLDQAVPKADLCFSLSGDKIEGFCQVQDALEDLTIIGAFNFGLDKIDFSGKLLTDREGNLKFNNFLINNKFILTGNIDMPGKDGYLLIVDEQSRNNILEIALSTYTDSNFLSQGKINHLQLLGHDLVTNVAIKGNWLSPGSKFFLGHIASSGTIIDYNPADELEIDFKISKETFTLNSLKFGHSYELLGTLGLARPYPVNSTLTITQAHPSDLLILAKNKLEKEQVAGELNGRIEVKGPLANLETRGYLEGKNGNIGTIKYETANINLKGSGPVISVDGSRIFRSGEGKYLTLDGFIDLANLGSGHLLQNLKVSSDEKTILWSGWDITKKRDETKLSFQKDVGQEFKVGFSTFINDEREDNLKTDKDAVELEYSVSQNRSLKLKLKENEEIVGMEHKIKF